MYCSATDVLFVSPPLKSPNWTSAHPPPTVRACHQATVSARTMFLLVLSSRTGAIGVAVVLAFLLPTLPRGECAFLYHPAAPTTSTSALRDQSPKRVGGGGRGSNNNSKIRSRSRGSTSSSATGRRNRRDVTANIIVHDDDDDDTLQRQLVQPQPLHTSMSSTINCPHFGECPGCITDTNVSDIDIMHSAQLYFSSSSVKRYIIAHNDNKNEAVNEKEFYKIKIPSPITHWRTQAKLAVGPPSSSSKSRLLQSGISIGLYRRNSHNILSIPQCQVHHPNINIASSLLAQAAQTVRITPYNEFDGRGLLRYAQFRVETTTGKVCLTLVMNVEKLKECQPQLSRLVKELQRLDKDFGSDSDGQESESNGSGGDGNDTNANADIDGNKNGEDYKQGRIFHSIWVHCNDSEGNAIFARDVSKWHPIFGPRYVREPIPGSLSPSKTSLSCDDGGKGDGYLYFAPYVFRQGNMHGFTDIAKEVSMAMQPGSKVCELYAGVGLLGLSALLHHGRRRVNINEEGGGGGLGWLRCSDENPENARCFELAVESMPQQITGRVTRSKFQKDGGRGKRDSVCGKKTKAQHSGKGGGGSDLSIKDLMDSVVYESGDSSSTFSFEADPSEKVTYMQANAVSALYRGQALGASVIIVDPPRRGLDEVVLQMLSTKVNPNQLYTESPVMLSHIPRHVVNWTNDARTLIYVSCGFDALARDLDKLLTSNAGWKLVSATGYVLFPGSNHVETVVVLER